MSILSLEVQQHMLKKVNNACPSLPFAHIKAMVNSDTNVFFRFIVIFLYFLAKIKQFACEINNSVCAGCFLLSYDHLGISRWLYAEVIRSGSF